MVTKTKPLGTKTRTEETMTISRTVSTNQGTKGEIGTTRTQGTTDKKTEIALARISKISSTIAHSSATATTTLGAHIRTEEALTVATIPTKLLTHLRLILEAILMVPLPKSIQGQLWTQDTEALHYPTQWGMG